MKKVLLMSLDIIDDLNGDPMFNALVECLNQVITDGNELAFMSRSEYRLRTAKQHYEHMNNNFKFISRNQAKNIIQTHGKNYFIILGNRNIDFLNAVHHKILLLYPTWTKELEPKAKKYGLQIANPKELLEIINSTNIQQSDLDIPMNFKEPKYAGIRVDKDIYLEYKKLLKKNNITGKDFFNALMLSVINSHNKKLP
ncbi:hypothetical protein [Clostridium sp. Cult2]|uniref:hypothetical protein n=1 Tax=Clostridium sp. Cult2 TaxID=2079003 RepID=UPI001F307AD3|nr:hypothetical protein [Clostridium sp. Cult2]MCF6466391.1 hypothetical protein [Clostridium sp. Cult2]